MKKKRRSSEWHILSLIYFIIFFFYDFMCAISTTALCIFAACRSDSVYIICSIKNCAVVYEYMCVIVTRTFKIKILEKNAIRLKMISMLDFFFFKKVHNRRIVVYATTTWILFLNVIRLRFLIYIKISCSNNKQRSEIRTRV